MTYALCALRTFTIVSGVGVPSTHCRIKLAGLIASKLSAIIRLAMPPNSTKVEYRGARTCADRQDMRQPGTCKVGNSAIWAAFVADRVQAQAHGFWMHL